MSAAVDTAVSPFLQGSFEPIAEELDRSGLAVEGELPAGLRGTYMRNGSNPAFTPPGRYHIFDGDGMVHAVELGDERRYRNRWVESRGLRYERSLGHAVYGGLAEFNMPDTETIQSGGLIKNTANTNVVRHAGRILALMEGGRPTELTEALDTVGEFDFDGALPGAMTAHPKFDPATGEMVFFAYSPMPPHLSYYTADAEGALTTSRVIDTPRPTMMHDFVMTEGHVAFFDMPAVFDIQAMMSGGTSITWQPEHGARIGLLDRAGEGEVQWFELDAFYVFHFLNAWEDDQGRVRIVGCRAPGLLTNFGEEPSEPSDPPVLWRWTLDPATGTVTDEQLEDVPTDFPRINDAFAGRASRFGYSAHATSWDESGVDFDGVIKHDLVSGTTVEHVYPAPLFGGEPVFAADPAGRSEDDGWIINLATDHSAGRSELIVHDAHDLDIVARVQLPHRVPSGFHGNWMPTTG